MAGKKNGQRRPAKKATKAKAAKAEKTTVAADTAAVQPSAAAAEAAAEPVAVAPETAQAARRLSALDAAAQVLAETGQPLSCPELIAAMAAKGYWSSPKGKTPAATLYSALTRAITTKGAAARFCKVGRGQFARSGPA